MRFGLGILTTHHESKLTCLRVAKVTTIHKGQREELTMNATGGVSWKENTNHRETHDEKENVAEMELKIYLIKQLV